MSEHKAQINWKKSIESFDYDKYNRDHIIMFNTKNAINASAAGELKGNPDNVDPEQQLTASLSSCHMLTFLAIASRKKYVVDSYQDNPIGVMEKNETGMLSVTKVTLYPKAVFSGDRIPTADELNGLHESAHKYCVIANSIKTPVEIKPRIE